MMSFKQLRRRFLPRGFGVATRRRLRDRLLARFGLERSYKPAALVDRANLVQQSVFPLVIADHLLHHGDLTFVQIGAFDGVKNDDLFELVRRHRLRGVLVEPQPAAFAQLQQNYRDQPQVKLLNVAIAETAGTQTLYVPRGGASTVASFDRAHLLRHGIDPHDIVARSVQCLPREDALGQTSFNPIDLIQIDAEGYDFEILRTIDFDRFQPAIVRYEYRHLSRRDADRAIELLQRHGYRFWVEERDIVACKLARPHGTAAAA